MPAPRFATRTGSHNLILGAQNNYSSYYSSYGSLVAADYDTVSGGNSVSEGTNDGWAAGSLHSP